MAYRYGRFRCGWCLRSIVLHDYGKTTTLTTGLRLAGVSAPDVFRRQRRHVQSWLIKGLGVQGRD
ncbi:hypothetical protein [Asaia lannensis]|uniref:hypothetical protein n=1 Tax=Asaia lannensis TaxID=415421 RepID=UPI001C9907F3